MLICLSVTTIRSNWIFLQKAVKALLHKGEILLHAQRSGQRSDVKIHASLSNMEQFLCHTQNTVVCVSKMKKRSGFQ